MNFAVIARTNQNQDVFWVGPDGSMYTATQTNEQPWSNKIGLGGNFVPGSTVSAVSRASDSVNLFAIDKTGNVCHAWWSGARGWECIGNKYEILGTGLTPGAPLAAIARTSNHLDLFTTGKDGRVLTANWGGGKPWSSFATNKSWRPISQAFGANTPVTVVSRSPQHLDLFLTGPDGRVYSSWWQEVGIGRRPGRLSVVSSLRVLRLPQSAGALAVLIFSLWIRMARSLPINGPSAGTGTALRMVASGWRSAVAPFPGQRWR